MESLLELMASLDKTARRKLDGVVGNTARIYPLLIEAFSVVEEAQTAEVEGVLLEVAPFLRDPNQVEPFFRAYEKIRSLDVEVPLVSVVRTALNAYVMGYVEAIGHYGEKTENRGNEDESPSSIIPSIIV